jgi:glycine/D-amino acid oxidase-like deaminating enzyme
MKTFDIAIIGRGITGLSAALHLNQAGFRNLCMIAPPMASQNNASSNAHFATVTLQDNMSRFAHNLGSELALASVELNRKGFASLLDFVRAHKLQHELGEVRRFADSDHEAQEMAIATKWLTSHGFPAEFRSMNGVMIQRDGAASLSLDGPEILTAISVAAPRQDIDDQVVTMTPHASGITMELASGQKISSEMVILACHRGIKDLLPMMNQALVNHADQFVIFRTNKTIANAKPGDVLLTQHSQFWAVIKTPNRIVAGGAKFLRKWGGIEAVIPDVLPQATTAIAKKFAPILGVKQLELETAGGLIDLRACDERPLIGPMFGNSRILLASGYMGSGMTLGFAAGQGLAEFVSHGRSHLIDECFHPSRLRSLPDVD